MKNSRKLLLTSLCGLAAVAIYACGSTGQQGEPGAAGAKGDSCSVVTNEDGTATIKCTDGSSFNIVNGKDANPGDAGSDGKDGQNGKPCYLTENSDGSAAVVCPADGSSYIVRGNTDNYANYCKKGFWGKNCENECNCQNDGICNDGVTGDGSCSCKDNWDGQNCDECAEGWDGQNCDECADDLSGAHCDLPKTCKNGTPNLGVNGNGECSSCFDKWDGPNCDKCPAGFYHVGDNCFDCRKGAADSAFDTDKCTYTDTRNEQTTTYNVVTIGDQLWMAQNMAFAPSGKTLGTDYFYPDNNSSNLKDYGYLYTWETAKSVCPPSWHLPSGSSQNNETTQKYDFNKLLTYVTNNKSDANISDVLALIANSPAWTDYENQGLDEFGFGALPAGYYDSGYYDHFGYYGYFWSSKERNSSGAYFLVLGGGDANVGTYSKATGNSVRCLKD